MAFSVSKPVMPEMSSVATLPVISLVMAMLSPCSIRKEPSVTRKLGSLVFTSSQPLTAPSASAKASEKTAPTHRLPATCVAKIEAASEIEVTATPADRSNSPPIINNATATAGMPIVED